MPHLDVPKSPATRSLRGLCGAALFTALVAWTVFVNPTAYGGISTNITTTTSTTHEPASRCPSGTETVLTVSLSFGPTTIWIGDDQSQAFFVKAGTENINTNTAFVTYICKVGTPAMSLAGLAFCAVLLAAYAVLRLRRL